MGKKGIKRRRSPQRDPPKMNKKGIKRRESPQRRILQERSPQRRSPQRRERDQGEIGEIHARRDQVPKLSQNQMMKS